VRRGQICFLCSRSLANEDLCKIFRCVFLKNQCAVPQPFPCPVSKKDWTTSCLEIKFWSLDTLCLILKVFLSLIQGFI